MDHLGTFDADRIRKIAVETMRQAKSRRDFVADRKSLAVTGGEAGFSLTVKGQEPLTLRRHSLQQLCNTLEVPLRYLDRLTGAGHHDLAAEALNDILQREPKRHLVRTLDGRADAILSDRYRAISNEAVLGIALEEAKRAGAQVWDLRSSPDEFRFLAAAPHISGKVDTAAGFSGSSRWEGSQGDVLNAALTISNSETGMGSFSARPSILRRVCQNFCVWADGVARVHIGKKIDVEGEVFFSDETRRLDDAALLSKVRDVIKHTFDPAEFAKRIETINATTKVKVEKPVEAVNAVVTAFGLPQERVEAILEGMLTGGKTQWALVNAVTAQANPDNAMGLDDEQRSRFEDVGGAILGFSQTRFSALVAGKATLVGASN